VKPHWQFKRKRSSRKTRQRSGDYRIFIGAFLTNDLAEKIQAVRQRLDLKTAQITAPHVTLAGTYWRNGPARAKTEKDLIRRLSPLGSKLKSFELHLGGVQTFGRRMIYLGVKPSDELLSVRTALLRVIGQDKHRRFRPHLTLAMRLEPPEFDRHLAELRESEWSSGRFITVINELHLMQRGPEDPAWRSISKIELL
jgi:2'-5' RNA ligase